MKIKNGTTAYNFECLERTSIKECFEQGGADSLRELVDKLRSDIDVLVRLAAAIDAGESYDIGRDRIRTWWGWG